MASYPVPREEFTSDSSLSVLLEPTLSASNATPKNTKDSNCIHSVIAR